MFFFLSLGGGFFLCGGGGFFGEMWLGLGGGGGGGGGYFYNSFKSSIHFPVHGVMSASGIDCHCFHFHQYVQNIEIYKDKLDTNSFLVISRFQYRFLSK